jgi:C1A family cysteine protease
MVTLKRSKDFFSFLVLFSAFFVVVGSVVYQTPSIAQESDESRLAEISEINRVIQETGAKWVAGETSVSRLSWEEKQKRLGLIKPEITEAMQLTEPDLIFHDRIPLALSPSLDWRSNGGNFVTPVRNQGGCGSCWAFATTGALESYTLIRNNTPGIDLNLSEQVMVSCGVSGGYDAGGCGGGYIQYASDYIRNTGLPAETCYLYTGTDGNCANASNACPNWESSAYKITKWSYAGYPYGSVATVEGLKTALTTYGPLVTTMDVYTDFDHYTSGVYSLTPGQTYRGGHAILLIGYNEPGQYFICKNSWNTGWGDGGYFNVAYSEIDRCITENNTTKCVNFGEWTIAYGDPIPSNPETVSAPTTLSGTTSGSPSSSYSYSTGGSTSSSGHSVQYRFDWGDGTNSGWLSVGTTSASKSWSSLGTYSVKTQARCSADTSVLSSSSNSLDVTITCPTPGTPSTPSPSNGAPGVSRSPTLSWSSSNASSYDVYFGTEMTPPLVTTTSSTSYTSSSLNYGTTYYWRIVAKNSCGGSATGSVWSFTTECATLGAPSGPSPSNGAAGVSTTPTLNWTSSNASSYDVYFGTVADPPRVTTTTGASYSPPGLNNNTTYYWKVVAKNACGGSATGLMWSFTTACGTPGAPSVSSPLNGATGISTTPTLSWTSSNASSYDVYFGTVSTPPLVTTTTSASYSPPSLSNNTKYYWKIVAKNSCGGSATGLMWSFTTACVTPGTPSISSPSDGATEVSTNPTLSWTGSNASSYDVYFGTSSSPSSYVATTTSTSYSTSGLNNNTPYYWKIVAKNSCGDLTAGPVWHFTTVVGVSTPVAVIQPNGGETIPVGFTQTIRWSAPIQATKFNLAYSTNNGATWRSIASNVTGSSYSWQVPILTNSQKRCRVRVVGLDSKGVKVGEDRSDSTFAILGVRVTAPAVGATLTSGSTQAITWEKTGAIGPVGDAKIYYSKNGGVTWILIATVSGGTSSYTWPVPSTNGVIKNNCKVKVVLRDEGKTKILATDINDGYFTLQPGASPPTLPGVT